MELKLRQKRSESRQNWFKLYLYGIEMVSSPSSVLGAMCSNCTFMELKYQVPCGKCIACQFKLYLYGIEIGERMRLQPEKQKVQIVPLWN